MARPVTLSNGSVFVGLNEQGLIDDFYYPYVGLENLKTARLAPHKVGVFVDGIFRWVDDKWKINMSYEADSMVGSTILTCHELGIELHFNDAVDAYEDAFMRLITIRNLSQTKKQVKLFLHQVFQLSKNGHADTAFFVPEDNYIFDYKGHTAIIVYSHHQGQHFKEFAVGNYGIEGKSGTYQDAEDGQLSGNLVEHGGVDSVIGHTIDLEASSETVIEYWLAMGRNQQEAGRLHELIKQEGVSNRIEYTRSYWKNWLKTAYGKLEGIDQDISQEIITSLKFIASHIDKHGAIIASGDSSLYNYGRDYYGYCWPRDGAFALWPLIKLGYTDEPVRFFDFCQRVMYPDGYLQHKFQADGAYGSTWHPMMQEHHKELAIQEDETAIVLYMLAEYVETSQDTEYFKTSYSRFIKPCMDFMTNYIDEKTGLPHASYELWEQKFTTSTYTSFLVSCTLRRIAKLANEIMQDQQVGRWVAAAERIDGNLNKLFDQEKQYFIKGLYLKQDETITYDTTLDVSSAYGVFMFGGQVRDSFALAQTVAAIEEQLIKQTPVGGVPRYLHDDYLLENKKMPGNPWFVCSFWMIQYYNYIGADDKRDALLKWTKEHMDHSGMMSEQIHPESSSQVGVGPLVWSHAEHINTLLDIYLN